MTRPSMGLLNSPMNANNNTYIIDYFNVFSDFREMKYKKDNVDFHFVKHSAKEKDTIEFFDFFFSKYLHSISIDKNSNFMFVMKKLNGYDTILEYIIGKHNMYNIQLIIIDEKLDDNVLDKNKDDFLCQYIFYTLKTQLTEKVDVFLISNDKYRDRQSYIALFIIHIQALKISTMKWNTERSMIEKTTMTFRVNRHYINSLLKQKCIRCTIPKHKLNDIL